MSEKVTNRQTRAVLLSNVSLNAIFLSDSYVESAERSVGHL